MSALHLWENCRIWLYSRIGFREEGTNVINDDRPIRLNRNLIHRMISSKTTQKPASTAWYPVLSRSKQDWYTWTHNTWQSRLIWVRLLESMRSTHHIGFETGTCNVRIIKQDKADSNQSKLGKKSVAWIKHKAQFKATRGNLMNLLDLAKSNRVDN
jgi:hypothetical protein